VGRRRTAPRAELGRAGLGVGRRCELIDGSAWAFLWVVDFPMFEPIEDDKGEFQGWHAVHHPFTAPTAESLDSFDKDPGSALSNAYDLVLNGSEIGGGSIRIHQKDVQKRAFDAIGLSEEEAQSQFGFLLNAFDFGPPPHGGIALGLDRLVALPGGYDTLRDGMAFPKASPGRHPPTSTLASTQPPTHGDPARKPW